MDGGIQPERPEELGANEFMRDGGNGVLMISDKCKMMCSTYGQNPRLLPTSLTETTDVPQTIDRVPEGHYQQWVRGCLAGYGNIKMNSSFDVARPLSESILMGNLVIRSYDIQERYTNENGDKRTRYPGRNTRLLWGGLNMHITNFEPANQFVKREYQRNDYLIKTIFFVSKSSPTVIL